MSLRAAKQSQRVEDEIAGGTGIPGSGSGAGLPIMDRRDACPTFRSSQ